MIVLIGVGIATIFGFILFELFQRLRLQESRLEKMIPLLRDMPKMVHYLVEQRIKNMPLFVQNDQHQMGQRKRRHSIR